MLILSIATATICFRRGPSPRPGCAACCAARLPRCGWRRAASSLRPIGGSGRSLWGARTEKRPGRWPRMYANCTPALPRLWLKRTARCACSTPGIRKVALPPACCWTTRRKNSAPMCSARIPARSIRPTRRTCCSRPCWKRPAGRASAMCTWAWASMKVFCASSANGAAGPICPMSWPPGRKKRVPRATIRPAR